MIFPKLLIIPESDIIKNNNLFCESITKRLAGKRGMKMHIKNCLLDLHVHLDGSLSVDTVRELARMQGISLVEADTGTQHTALDMDSMNAQVDDNILRKRLQVSADCQDLNEYLTKFDFPLQLLQTPEAMETSVRRLLVQQWQQGLIYSEIRFAPQLHTRRGMSQYEAVEAALEGLYQGMRQTSIRSGLILCCMRGQNNAEMNAETVQVAERYLGNGVAALDLAGAEGLFPTTDYETLFQQAKVKGIPFTIHAGEAAGPESIWAALRYGAARIGHGVRAVEDKKLMQALASSGVTLELCPTSNLNTKVVSKISDYPIKTLMDAGVRVTINTDNMTVSGTTAAEEISQIQQTFHLSDKQVEQLLFNAAEAAFTTAVVKTELRGKIEGQYALYCD